MDKPEKVTSLPWIKMQDAIKSKVVAEYNSKYSLINLSGQVLVMRVDQEGEHFMKPADFKLWKKNEFVWLPVNGDGKKKKVEKYEIWIEASNRKQYREIVFKPGVTVEPDIYNLWKGFAVEPKEGDWSLMENHILNVLCGGNMDHWDWFLKWCSAVVYHCLDSKKYRRPEVAMVLKGQRGIGKDTFCECFGEIFGPHYTCISQREHVLGRFNDCLKNIIFCHISEAFWAGDKQAEGIIKALITNPRQVSEAKYRNPLELDSHLNFIISSNEDWVIPAGPKERRFFVPTMTDKNPSEKDPEYFKNLRHQWKNGGAAAMLYDLIHVVKYSEKDFTRPPVTEELKHQSMMSGSLHVQFWGECLSENIEIPWSCEISSQELHNKFISFCDQINHRGRRPSPKPFMKEFFKMTGMEPARCYFGKDRQRGVKLTDIESANNIFKKFMGWS
jgi:hypothetical protein